MYQNIVPFCLLSDRMDLNKGCYIQSALFIPTFDLNDKTRYNDSLFGIEPQIKMRQLIRDIKEYGS